MVAWLPLMLQHTQPGTAAKVSIFTTISISIIYNEITALTLVCVPSTEKNRKRNEKCNL